MGVFDTFYILFKSNAKEVTKDNREAEKSGKDLEESLAKQNKASEELGKNFTKIVEGLTSAVTAYVSFGAIKSGIMTAGQLEVGLERVHQATGQNVQDIAAYGNALAQFGGSAQGFQETLRSMTQTAAMAGRQLPPVAGFLREINREFQGLSLNESARRAGILGITDPAMIQLLRQTPEIYDAIIAKQKELSGITPEGTKAANEFAMEWNLATTSINGVFTKIAEDLYPSLKDLAVILQVVGKYLQGHEGLAASGLAAIAAGFTAISGAIIGAMVPALGALTVAAAPWLIAATAIVGGIAAVDAAIDAFMGKKNDKSLSRSVTIGPKGGNNAAVDYFQTQGYTKEQSAGIVANLQRESNLNPAARGDGGLASGIAQWHPDRVKKILEGTGIDVRSAGLDDQLKAVAWELKQTGLSEKLKGITGFNAAGESASFFSKNFERPANEQREAWLRSVMAGKIAIETASTSPFSSNSGQITNSTGDKNMSVKIGEIHIETQATDANGISAEIAQSLQGHITNTITNYDDGVSL